MKVGDLITIHDLKSFAHGKVEAIGPPADLPDIPGQRGDQVRAILAEENIHQVALFSYDFMGQELCFVALQKPTGKWFDLQGSEIWVEVRHAETEADVRDLQRSRRQQHAIN